MGHIILKTLWYKIGTNARGGSRTTHRYLLICQVVGFKSLLACSWHLLSVTDRKIFLCEGRFAQQGTCRAAAAGTAKKIEEANYTKMKWKKEPEREGRNLLLWKAGHRAKGAEEKEVTKMSWYQSTTDVSGKILNATHWRKVRLHTESTGLPCHQSYAWTSCLEILPRGQARNSLCPQNRSRAQVTADAALNSHGVQLNTWCFWLDGSTLCTAVLSSHGTLEDISVVSRRLQRQGWTFQRCKRAYFSFSL